MEILAADRLTSPPPNPRTEGEKPEKNPRSTGETDYNNSTLMSSTELYQCGLPSNYKARPTGLNLKFIGERQCANRICRPWSLSTILYCQCHNNVIPAMFSCQCCSILLDKVGTTMLTVVNSKLHGLSINICFSSLPVSTTVKERSCFMI